MVGKFVPIKGMVWFGEGKRYEKRERNGREEKRGKERRKRKAKTGKEQVGSMLPRGCYINI